jgi:hypothetical protein
MVRARGRQVALASRLLRPRWVPGDRDHPSKSDGALGLLIFLLWAIATVLALSQL